MKLFPLLLLVAALALPASAQVVVQAAEAKVQPIIGRDTDGYNSCGVRAVVLDIKSEVVEAYDFSLYLRLGMQVGTFKAGKLQNSIERINQGKYEQKAVLPAPTTFWIAKESEGKAMVPLKTLPADTPGYILGGADLGATASALMAVTGGERMQFAIRYKSQPYDTVVSFAPTLSEQESAPLIACFTGLFDRMREQSDAVK